MDWIIISLSISNLVAKSVVQVTPNDATEAVANAGQGTDEGKVSIVSDVDLTKGLIFSVSIDIWMMQMMKAIITLL